MSILQLTNINKNFAGLEVLNDISFNLEKGEVLGLFGHNGAGKTTLMKLILGLMMPSSGQVSVFGQNPCTTDFSQYRYQLGFLPENVSFYQHLSGLEVLMFFAKLKNISKQRCIDLLQQIGLYDARMRKVKTYSKGMKQRLGLAQALLTEPSLLLLDEPTVGLDPIATQELYALIDALKRKGCSIILCSHILPEVEKYIDKAVILSQGKVQAYGSIEELRSRTQINSRINFTSQLSAEKLNHQLQPTINDLGNQHFSLDVSCADKMTIAKDLINDEHISDINIYPPSLEELYRYYIDKEFRQRVISQRQGQQAESGNQP